MTKSERLQLLKLEMLRCIEIIDSVDFESKPKYGDGDNTAFYEWIACAKTGKAELISKMHEIRRDTVAIEKDLKALNLY